MARSAEAARLCTRPVGLPGPFPVQLVHLPPTPLPPLSPCRGAHLRAANTALRPAVTERAAALGLDVLDLGLKDLVLPGEMKALLNRVIEAQKEAEANVILRREETAATRSMAQTAKVLVENPLLVRLKELEA